jgi:Putative restriction endonuclease
MSTVSKHYITPEEYLHHERKAEFRSEYFRGEMFPMAGASANHNLIVLNAGSHLREQLKKKPCRVYPSDLKLRIEATGLYTYPDLSVVCGEPQFESDSGDVLLNPVGARRSPLGFHRGIRSRQKIRALSNHSQFKTLRLDCPRSTLDRLLYSIHRRQLEFDKLPRTRREDHVGRNRKRTGRFIANPAMGDSRGKSIVQSTRFAIVEVQSPPTSRLVLVFRQSML